MFLAANIFTRRSQTIALTQYMESLRRGVVVWESGWCVDKILYFGAISTTPGLWHNVERGIGACRYSQSFVNVHITTQKFMVCNVLDFLSVFLGQYCICISKSLEHNMYVFLITCSRCIVGASLLKRCRLSVLTGRSWEPRPPFLPSRVFKLILFMDVITIDNTSDLT